MQRLDGIVGAIPQYLMMLRSQYWTEDKLDRYVEKHLGATLAAARGIPFYRERFGADSSRSPELTTFPILPRHEIPQLAASVRALHSDSSMLASGLTSGSTGNPVSFFYDATHQASRFAARGRYLRENGWNPFRRSLWIISTRMQSRTFCPPCARSCSGADFFLIFCISSTWPTRSARWIPHTSIRI